MDDDVIDVSNIPYSEYKQHMKNISDKSKCPCNDCEPACDRASTKAICDRYKKWAKIFVLGGL